MQSDEDSEEQHEISAQLPKFLDPSKDPDWNGIKLAVLADKMRLPRGKGRDPKYRWYDDPNTWKHCFVKGCASLIGHRFKGPFRKHKNKLHLGISTDVDI